MKATDFNRHQTPPGGWKFYQAATGWNAPNPVSCTFNQQVENIIKHRLANPAITAKHKLLTDVEGVGIELENFNKKRLGVEEGVQPVPFPRRPALGASGAAGDRVENLEAGIGVVIDWLGDSLEPASPELANQRAEVCASCPQNGEPDFIQRLEGLAARGVHQLLKLKTDLSLSTPLDDKLHHCQLCDCFLRLKVHCRMEHILAHTSERVMASLPEHCWIKRKL